MAEASHERMDPLWKRAAWKVIDPVLIATAILLAPVLDHGRADHIDKDEDKDD
ncbi:MAG: hypothetical protein Q7R74_00695 [bacterium]|nr:hypothetical protein [bacterium]